MFSRKTAIVCAAAMGMGCATAVVCAAPVNTTVLANVQATNSDNSTTIYKIDIPNNTNIVGTNYIQDPANTAQYVGYGYGDGVNPGIGTGTITVQTYTDSQSVAHSGSIVMSTSETAPPDGGAALYFDTGPNPLVQANHVRVSFALDMVANGGITVNSFNDAAFAANIFAEYTSATRFIASPTSGSGGVFGLTQANGTLFSVGSYNNGQFYNIDVDLDFTNQLATLSVDGVAASPIAFRHAIAPASGNTSPQLTEVFFYQGANVPEPSSMGIFVGLAGLALLSRRSRRRIA